jgi:hypothetical protein
MNDFDFEELDKAVNELATKTHDEHGGPVPTAPAPAPSQASAEEKPVLVRSSTPAPAPVEPPKVEEAKPAPTPTAEPQKRPTRLSDTRPQRRGAFMDIVTPQTRKPGTRGVSIQPVSKPEDIIPDEPQKQEEPVALEPEQPKASEVEPTPVVTEPEAEKPQAEVKKDSGDVAWPDPLDFDGNDPQKEKTDEAPEPKAEAVDSASPFLAEAKVEKRPLGAFSNFRPRREEKPQQEPTQQPAPEEIKPADELTPEKDGTFKEPAEPGEPAQPTEEEAKPTKAPLASDEKEAAEPSKPDMHGAAMMSIPQQYRAEAKETDKSTRPIFDTKEYHPPLLESAVHDHRGGGSMWGKLFIALVVLALLGVAGYFAYLYVMQR